MVEPSDALCLLGVTVLLLGAAGVGSFSFWMRRYGPVWFVSALRAGRYDVALSRLERATRWDLDLAVWAPVILLDAGRPDQARSRLVHLLMEPRPVAGEALCRFLLAQALLDLGDVQAARAEVERSARLAPGPRVSWLRAELDLREGTVDDDTVDQARAAVRMLEAQGGSRVLGDPEPLYRATLAWALASRGAPDAQAALEAAARALPKGAGELAGCAFRVGWAHACMGAGEVAAGWWARGAAADPDGADGARCAAAHQAAEDDGRSPR